MLHILGGTSFSSWALLGAASKSTFWNDKNADQWSSEERNELIGNSPWAKQVRADTTRAQPVGPPLGGTGSNVPMRMPGSVGGGGGGRSRRGPGNFAFNGIVRWESATPVLLALKKKLPSELEDHYVIGVSGFPLGLRNPQSQGDNKDEGSEAQVDELKQVTTLRAKGKDAAQAGVVLRSSDSDGPVYLFGFSRDVISIELKDKNVVFDTQFGPLDIEAKFDPKQMLYHGQLDL
jgi:hypothetical protein